MGKPSDPDPNTHRFGELTKSLRDARGLTQEQLAERSGLSADTIRRAEHGDFSPSLKTIGKLARGLDLDLSTLFTAFDLAEIEIDRELINVARRRMSQTERLAALRLLSCLVEIVQGVASEGEDD